MANALPRILQTNAHLEFEITSRMVDESEKYAIPTGHLPRRDRDIARKTVEHAKVDEAADIINECNMEGGFSTRSAELRRTAILERLVQPAHAAQTTERVHANELRHHELLLYLDKHMKFHRPEHMIGLQNLATLTSPTAQPMVLTPNVDFPIEKLHLYFPTCRTQTSFSLSDVFTAVRHWHGQAEECAVLKGSIATTASLMEERTSTHANATARLNQSIELQNIQITAQSAEIERLRALNETLITPANHDSKMKLETERVQQQFNRKLESAQRLANDDLAKTRRESEAMVRSKEDRIFSLEQHLIKEKQDRLADNTAAALQRARETGGEQATDRIISQLQTSCQEATHRTNVVDQELQAERKTTRDQVEALKQTEVVSAARYQDLENLREEHVTLSRTANELQEQVYLLEGNANDIQAKTSIIVGLETQAASMKQKHLMLLEEQSLLSDKIKLLNKEKDKADGDYWKQQICITGLREEIRSLNTGSAERDKMWSDDLKELRRSAKVTARDNRRIMRSLCRAIGISGLRETDPATLLTAPTRRMDAQGYVDPIAVTSDMHWRLLSPKGEFATTSVPDCIAVTHRICILASFAGYESATLGNVELLMKMLDRNQELDDGWDERLTDAAHVLVSRRSDENEDHTATVAILQLMTILVKHAPHQLQQVRSIIARIEPSDREYENPVIRTLAIWLVHTVHPEVNDANPVGSTLDVVREQFDGEPAQTCSTACDVTGNYRLVGCEDGLLVANATTRTILPVQWNHVRYERNSGAATYTFRVSFNDNGLWDSHAIEIEQSEQLDRWLIRWMGQQLARERDEMFELFGELM